MTALSAKICLHMITLPGDSCIQSKALTTRTFLRRHYHEVFLYEMASQWQVSSTFKDHHLLSQVGQMIPFIEWNGAEKDSTSGVYLEPAYGTNYGICSWISPFFRMPQEGNERNLLSLVPGALNGENNGLSVLLDAETFDYGNGFYDLGVRAGEGFKVAVVHPLDMPIIQQTAVNVMPGSLVQIATSINLINITSDAMAFAPKERKCWVDSEIELKELNYTKGYRYTMTNCLYEATMQVAYNNCSCYPGEPCQRP